MIKEPDALANSTAALGPHALPTLHFLSARALKEVGPVYNVNAYFCHKRHNLPKLGKGRSVY